MAGSTDWESCLCFCFLMKPRGSLLVSGSVFSRNCSSAQKLIDSLWVHQGSAGLLVTPPPPPSQTWFLSWLSVNQPSSITHWESLACLSVPHNSLIITHTSAKTRPWLCGWRNQNFPSTLWPPKCKHWLTAGIIAKDMRQLSVIDPALCADIRLPMINSSSGISISNLEGNVISEKDSDIVSSGGGKAALLFWMSGL